MTRINVVAVNTLWKGHLIAEHKELPRVYDLVRKAISKGHDPKDYLDLFPEYVLGEGHIKFFYARLGYIQKRERELVKELLKRGMPLATPLQDVRDIPFSWFSDYEPTPEAIILNTGRIQERLRYLNRAQMKGFIAEYPQKG